MSEDSLAQVTRMVQDNNLPSTTLATQEMSENPDARFVHPDDTRDRPQTAQQSEALESATPTVLICTDAAMHMVPKVRCQLHSLQHTNTRTPSCCSRCTDIATCSWRLCNVPEYHGRCSILLLNRLAHFAVYHQLFGPRICNSDPMLHHSCDSTFCLILTWHLLCSMSCHWGHSYW